MSNRVFCMKSLEEGQNCGFDRSLREILIESSLAHHVLESILKVGLGYSLKK